MKKKIIGALFLLVIFVFMFTTSKITAGVPVDATTDEPDTTDEEDPEAEEEEEGILRFGMTGLDTDDPYCGVVKKSIEIELNRKNYRLLYKKVESTDAKEQLAQVEELIQERVDAVFFCPVDRESEYTEQALQALRDAEIPIINLETQVKDLGEVQAFVGSDNRQAGYICGKDLVDRMEDGGKVVLLENSSVNAINERITGFEKAIANKGFEIIERKDIEGDAGQAKEAMASVLAENKEIDVVMCGNDQMALAALQAVQEAGRSDILIYGVEGSPELKQELAKNNTQIAGTAAQSPIRVGLKAVEAAVKILNGKDYDQTTLETVHFISKENIALYGADGWQ